MTKRLELLLDDAEFREIQAAARRQGMSVTEWVRSTLLAGQAEDTANRRRALAAVRAARSGDFPTGDIDQILAEIEAGYADDIKS